MERSGIHQTLRDNARIKRLVDSGAKGACIHPTRSAWHTRWLKASSNLQRLQNRQLLIREALRLRSQLDDVFFGALQRLSFLDDLLPLAYENPPHQLRPFRGLLFAVDNGQQEPLLRSNGIVGHVRPEIAVTMVRNTQSDPMALFIYA